MGRPDRSPGAWDGGGAPENKVLGLGVCGSGNPQILKCSSHRCPGANPMNKSKAPNPSHIHVLPGPVAFSVVTPKGSKTT